MTYRDKSGRELPKDEILDLAKDNIVISMSAYELAEIYTDQMMSDELLQWATDENGLFPPEEVLELKFSYRRSLKNAK